MNVDMTPVEFAQMAADNATNLEALTWYARASLRDYSFADSPSAPDWFKQDAEEWAGRATCCVCFKTLETSAAIPQWLVRLKDLRAIGRAHLTCARNQGREFHYVESRGKSERDAVEDAWYMRLWIHRTEQHEFPHYKYLAAIALMSHRSPQEFDRILRHWKYHLAIKDQAQERRVIDEFEARRAECQAYLDGRADLKEVM